MIAFGTSVSDSSDYRRHAQPGIERSAESGSDVYAFQSVGAIGRSSNLVLDHAATLDDLEALVLVDQRVELVDPGLCEKVRSCLGDQAVGVVGAVGAKGVRSIAWWEGDISSGTVTHRYPEYEGGELPAFSWKQHSPAPQEVDALDASLLVLSPWAVRNVRFDESLALGYGHGVDYCMQVRAAGRRVMTADFQLVHHRSIEVVEDPELWTEAHIQFAEKWDDTLVDDPPDSDAWKRRARRAEAEREAAHTIAYSAASTLVAQLASVEHELNEATDTLAWRITAPLRQANHWRRSRAARQRRNDAR